MYALVKIIKNPFEEEKNIDITLNEEKCIYEIEGFDPNNSVSYVNGKHVTNDYKLKDGDVCVIRQFPEGITAGTTLTVGALIKLTAIVIGATAVAVGVGEAISFAVSGKGLFANIGEGIRKWLMPDSDNASNQQEIINLPSLSGSKNQSANGKSIPLILGRTYFAPYVIGNVYNTIDGEDGETDFYHKLMLIGYKDLQIEDVSIGLEVLAENKTNPVDNGALTITSEKFPYVVYKEEGGQQVIDKDKSYFTQLELQQGSNEVSIYPCKVVQENKNLQLKNVNGDAVYNYLYTARYPKKVEIEFTFGGLIGYNDKGETLSPEVEVVVEYSLDRGDTWTNCSNLIDFTKATGESAYVPSTESKEAHILFKNAKPKTLRYVLRQTFEKAQMEVCDSKVVQYRVKRINSQSTDTKVVDTVYVSAIRTWCYDATKSTGDTLVDQVPMNEKERNKTARLGFSIKVTEDLIDYFDQINLIATSKARTWDNINKRWSTTLSPTRNPVELALHAMTGDYRAPYRYEIDDTGSAPTCEKIDLDDFGAKAEICDQQKNFGTENDPYIDNRYYCDGVILNATKSVDLVNQILSTARSCLVLNGKKYGIFMDKEQDYPLLVLNNNNLLSLSYSKNFEEIPDAQQIKYISALNYYQQDTIVIKPIGSPAITSESKLETVEYPLITDPYHAKSMSLYKQACRTNRPETFVAEVTTEGGLAEIGSLIEIQSDRILVGMGDGAEITDLIIDNGYITGIKTDGKFTVTDTTKEYGVVINVVTNDILGETKTLKKKLSAFSSTGTYSDFTFDTPIDMAGSELPEEGCVLSFGFYQNETLETICIGKSEKGDGKYDLTIVPYSPEIFRADEGMINDFDPKVTPPKESGMPIDYGDKTTPATNLDISSMNGRMSQMADSISTLYSNHIVTLYKSSTLPLDSTGITGTCIYDFSNNTITWNGDNNGWSISKPITNDPVYVTSATAYGKSATDNILPNEWATPIPMGLNGENGVNTCTINLYKRLSESPTSLPETLTYNFATGSLLGEKNGWQTSIPDIDQADNAPCWEIHATALSTTTTDTIPPSEWTSPAKITQDGYSKDEIMSWIEEVQIESPNIYVTPSTGIFAVDDNGVIVLEQSVNIEVKVIQTNEEIDFAFGAIHVPEGFSIIANNHILTLTAQEGTKVTNCYFDIPIVFRQYSDNYYYGDTDGNAYVHLNCQDGQWYGEINSLSNLPSQVNNNYFLWTGVDTQSTEETVEGGIFKQNTYYYSNGTRFKEATYVSYGMSIQATSETTFNSTFGISTVYGGTYYEAINAVANIPANAIVGDFFTWTGADQTSASIVQGGKLLAGCCYKWNGVEWIRDTSSKHRAMAMKELMSVAENKLAQNNSDVIEYIRELITMNVVTENIQVTGEALINSAITAQLTLGKSGETDGFIKSYNFDSTHGFTINANGSAVFNDVTVRGAIVATSLTLESGVNVPANKVDGLSDVATSGSYSDLDGTPNLSDVALSGDYGDLENKPALKTVATTGQYSDLLNPPDLSVYATKTALNEYAKLNQISTVTIGSPTTDAETGITSRTVTIAGVGAGTFAVQESDDFMTFAHAKSDELTLLTSQPSEWSTTYKQYFRKDSNNNYESLASLNSAPTWASNTYYSAEGKKFYSVDKNGLLVASNAVIWGTVYATNGEFTGTIHATDGEFTGIVQSENYQIGKEGFKLDTNGKCFINDCLFTKDIELPVQCNWVDLKDIELNLNTLTSAEIKTILDNLFDTYGSPTFTQDGVTSYVYANIVSIDENNPYVNYVFYTNFQELMTHFIYRYREDSHKIEYVISSDETAYIYSLKRTLIEVVDDVPYKVISPYSSNKLLIKSISKQAEFFTTVSARDHIKARLGHALVKQGYTSGSIPSATRTEGEVFEVLKTLLKNGDEDGVTFWYTDADDGMERRYPAMCAFTDSTKTKIRIFFFNGSYHDFEQGSTNETDKRWFYI